MRTPNFLCVHLHRVMLEWLVFDPGEIKVEISSNLPQFSSTFLTDFSTTHSILNDGPVRRNYYDSLL